MATITQPPQVNEEPAAPERVAVRKHLVGTRWMHWINFPLLTVMIWSGLRIYWADLRDPFGFGVGFVGWHWFDFLPDPINERLGLERRLARGLAFHFTFGWLFTINGLLYGLYTWRTGEWRHLLPDRHSFKDSIAVAKHDLFLGRGKPLPPQGRYNGAQRLTYTLIIWLGALAVVTGLAIYRPTQVNVLTTTFGGYESARTIHFIVTISFLVFFAVHIMQVVRSGWANFASMITGYELLPAGVKAHGGAATVAATETVEKPAALVDPVTDDVDEVSAEVDEVADEVSDEVSDEVADKVSYDADAVDHEAEEAVAEAEAIVADTVTETETEDTVVETEDAVADATETVVEEAADAVVEAEAAVDVSEARIEHAAEVELPPEDGLVIIDAPPTGQTAETASDEVDPDVSPTEPSVEDAADAPTDEEDDV